MGDFKRNSSRFNRGGASEGASPSRGNGGGYQARSGGQSEQRSQGNGGGGYQRRSSGGSGGNGGGGGKEFPFTRVASMTVPKSASDAAKEYAETELKGSELTLSAKVYLGKGDNELTLKNGDMLLLQFKTGDKDPEYVLGHISVKN